MYLGPCRGIEWICCFFWLSPREVHFQAEWRLMDCFCSDSVERLRSGFVFTLFWYFIHDYYLLILLQGTRRAYPVPSTNMHPKVENSVANEVGGKLQPWNLGLFTRQESCMTVHCFLPTKNKVSWGPQPLPHAPRLLFSTFPWLLYLDLKALALGSPKWSSWNVKLIWGHSS